MISSVSTLKRRGQYKLCNDLLHPKKDYDEQMCKNEFLDKPGSYAMSYDKNYSRSKCLHLQYKIECNSGNEAFGDEAKNITHKS